MDRRFEQRKQQLLDECEVPRAVFDGMQARLAKFAEPFVQCLTREEQREHARLYCSGLLSDLPRKNTESIAYRHDQERKNLQNFIGQSCWDHEPLLAKLAQQVGAELGEEDGVLVLDPSGFPKKGKHSVGVERQWCGRLGKVDNCQIGVYLGYVSSTEHTLVDMRLYLPKSWTSDRKRRKQGHIPKTVRYQSRTELALDMLLQRRSVLPHRWVTGDDELGRASWFRRRLRELGERYLMAVPSTTTIRDLEAQPPEYSGFGGVPKQRFISVAKWREALAPDAWKRIDVRDGTKGPLLVDIVACRVQARDEDRCVGCEEVLVVIRRTDDAGEMIHDYYFSNASHETPLAEFARPAKAHHRVEECIQRSKSQAGLADYEVRSYGGWYHHQALSLIATWFLVQESRRGKKIHSRDDGPTDRSRTRALAACSQSVRQSRSSRRRSYTPSPTKRAGEALSLEIAQQTGPNEHQQTAILEQ
jgi:SRSO17 transposase